VCVDIAFVQGNVCRHVSEWCLNDGIYVAYCPHTEESWGVGLRWPNVAAVISINPGGWCLRSYFFRSGTCAGHRFSAFWLRSKCSICSYQLNIWYVAHWVTSILTWFLDMGEVSGACSALATGWPGIAVPPGTAHSPQGRKFNTKSICPACPACLPVSQPASQPASQQA